MFYLFIPIIQELYQTSVDTLNYVVHNSALFFFLPQLLWIKQNSPTPFISLCLTSNPLTELLR